MLSDEDKDTIIIAVTKYEDMSDAAYDALCMYFSISGEMPIGVAKARTEDPYTWVHERMQSIWESDPVEFKHILEVL